jgi:multidrug transporter EmrE-like cation transporter
VLVFFGFVMMIACTVAANLLLKQGAMVPASDRVILGLLGLQSFAGLAMFGVSGLIYSWVLRSLPLNVAQSFAAAQFVAVIAASALVLAEPITPARWLGILLIALGILLVGLSVPPTA